MCNLHHGESKGVIRRCCCCCVAEGVCRVGSRSEWPGSHLAHAAERTQPRATSIQLLDHNYFLRLFFSFFFKAGHTVWMLLKVAKQTVPRLEWKRTPVVLRATAGLRLLPAVKAQALLDQVECCNAETRVFIGISAG